MSEKVDKMAKVRAAKKPAEYKNVHPDVKALDDDNYLSLKKVKEWEKHNKDRVKDLKYQIRRMDKGKEQNILIRELRNREAYLRSLATYLDSGVWLDLFYGQDQENRMRWKTIAFAYDDEGYVKTNNLEQPLDFYEDT